MPSLPDSRASTIPNVPTMAATSHDNTTQRRSWRSASAPANGVASIAASAAASTENE
jgi:hypothetical protein